MKFTRRKDHPTQYDMTSEGKLLEVIPVVIDNMGCPFMLPPVIWQVPNELLGFEDYHPVTMPMQFYLGERIRIPGTNSAGGCTLSFLVRLLEDSPSSGVSVATVDADACAALLQAIRESVRQL